MIVKAENITKIVIGPGNKPVTILEDISLNLQEGEFITILGPSGSGKTTLLQILGLMDSTSKGKLIFMGKDVSELSSVQKASIRANNIGFVFQSPLLIPELTLLENLILPNKLSDKNLNMEYIDDLLKKVNLSGKKNHYPRMLSTGEAQRGALARALINNPGVILADEPTANLDKDNKTLILDLLKLFSSEKNISIILASHDDMVLNYSKRFLKLEYGKMVSTEE